MKTLRVLLRASLLLALVACGGGGQTGGSPGLPGPGDDGADPVPSPSSPDRVVPDGTARFTVDVGTGEVDIEPLTGGRAILSGSVIEFSSSKLLDEPGSTGLKALEIALTNRWGLPVGVTPDGVETGLRADLVSIYQLTDFDDDISNFVQVSTLAGPGAPGAANVPAFVRPFDAAQTPDGGICFVALGEHRVYRLKDSTLSVLAGATTPGYSDGAGDSARFYHPIGIAWNPADEALVVTELTNRRVRRVTLSGEVTTIAGSGASGAANGNGAGASFEQPYGVAVTPAGVIYVVDGGSHSIRRIERTGSDPRQASSYQVTTLAGGAAGFADAVGTNARFQSPRGIALDPEGNLYVGDGGNNRVRRVSPTGEVVTIAGTGASGSNNGTGDVATFNSPFGVAWTPQGLYVTEYAGQRVRVVTQREGAAPAASGSWIVRRIAGVGSLGFADGTGSSASFATPVGIAPLDDQSLVVADSDNGALRRIVVEAGLLQVGDASGGNSAVPVRLTNPDGTIPNGAADETEPAPYVRYPGSLEPGETSAARRWIFAVDENAALFSFIVRIEAPTAALTSPPSEAGGASPEVLVRTILDAGVGGHVDGPLNRANIDSADGISVGPFGNVYIAQDGVDDCIRRIAYSLNPGGGLLAGPVSTVAGERGSGSGSVINGTGLAARFSECNDVEVAPDGNVLFITDSGNHVVRRAYLSGGDPMNPEHWTVNTIAGIGGSAGFADGTGTNAQFNWPYGIAVVDANTVYVTEYFGNRVRLLQYLGGNPASSTSWYVSLVAGDASASAGAAGTSDGAGLFARFDTPTGIAVSRSGTIYVADRNNRRIRTIDSANQVTTFAGSTYGYQDGSGTAARFREPVDLVVDDAGFVFVTDFTLIRRVDPAGNVTTVAGASVAGSADGPGPQARFSSLEGIGLFADGTLIVLDQPGGDRVALIQRVVGSGGS